MGVCEVGEDVVAGGRGTGGVVMSRGWEYKVEVYWGGESCVV